MKFFIVFIQLIKTLDSQTNNIKNRSKLNRKPIFSCFSFKNKNCTSKEDINDFQQIKDKKQFKFEKENVITKNYIKLRIFFRYILNNRLENYRKNQNHGQLESSKHNEQDIKKINFSNGSDEISKFHSNEYMISDRRTGGLCKILEYIQYENESYKPNPEPFINGNNIVVKAQIHNENNYKDA